MSLVRRSLLALFVSVVTSAGLAGCAPASGPARPVSAFTRTGLAPSGPLRVALYVGSPSSVVEPDGANPRGVGYDLGRALARRLGVPFAPVVFANNALALAAIRDGNADVIFTNATPAREKDMDFSPTFIDVEKGFLVPPGSALVGFGEVARPRTRVGVSAGSSTADELAPLFPDVQLVPVPTLKAATDMLRQGQLDAFATNKAILFEMADALPGSHVLDEHWGMEHFAAGTPKGRESDRPFMAAFIADARRDGTVARAIQRAGLRGTVPSPD